MSEALESAAAALREKMSGADLDETVKFEIEDEGTIMVEGGTVTTAEGDADVTIRATMETFREIFDGELSPTSAYMTGRMTIEGDMSVAMKLSQVLA